jgi:hypothetical protein
VSQTRAGGGVLAVFPGALGDFVCFLPAIEVLRARYGNRVALLCAGPLVDLARLAGVREVHAIEGREASWLFAATPPPQADRFYGRFEAIECFTGFGVPEVQRNVERWSAGRVHRFRPVERVHFAAHCLRAIGVAAKTPPEVELALDPGEARPLAGLPLNRAPRLVVHPGSGGLAKRWSRIGFRAVLERWRSEVGNADVVLGPAECSEIETWTIAGVRPLVPANVLDLARWLRRADVYSATIPARRTSRRPSGGVGSRCSVPRTTRSGGRSAHAFGCAVPYPGAVSTTCRHRVRSIRWSADFGNRRPGAHLDFKWARP